MSGRLRDLIRAVRQCKTAQQERDVIAKESAALRQAFKDQDVTYRHRNVAKLMYIQMLGYPTHFGQMETLKLIASNGFPEKRIGYLGLMLLLDERQEVLMLVTNSIKHDLNQRNQYITGLALTALGNISSTDMARDLAPDVQRLLGSNNAYIRKKAALCAARVVRKVPELLDEFTSRASSLLNDRHHGVLLTGVTLMIEICDMFPDVITEYRQHVPLLCKILKSLLMSGYAPEHDVGGLTDPFLQVKVLRLLRLLGRGDAEASDQMSDILAQVASNTESNRNAGNAILYECVQTIMAIEAIGGLRVLAINILGRFLGNKDNNIRYVALETLAQVVAVDTLAVQRHRNTIVECVKDADVSIRKRALDLVYALVNENNIKTLTNELLEYLEICDEEFKPDLTAKICMLVQRYAPDKRWYIDSLGQVLVQAGAYVKEEVVRAFVVSVSNAPDLQGYAVRLLYRALINMVEDSEEALRLAALWCLGEHGELLLPDRAPPLLPGEDPVTAAEAELVGLIEAILRRKDVTCTTKEYALTALIKLSARLPSQTERIRKGVLANNKSLLLEVQQRSCEFGRMFGHDDVRSHLVEAIPPLDESTYSSNLADQSVVDNAPALLSTADDLLQPTNGTTPVAGLTATAAATADLMDLLSLDVPTTNTPVGGSGGGAPVVDLLGDLLGNGPGASPPAAAAAASMPAPALGGMDLLGDVLGGPANSPPSVARLTPFTKDGITVVFELTQGVQAGTTSIKAIYTNAGPSPVSGFTLQAAVPKFMQLKLDPASGNVLPPNGTGTVTQMLHVTNSMHGQKPLVMRLRISYSVGGGAQVVEQCEVNNFPPGY